MIVAMLEIEPKLEPPATHLRKEFASVVDNWHTSTALKFTVSENSIPTTLSAINEQPINKIPSPIIVNTSGSNSMDYPISLVVHNRNQYDDLRHQVPERRMSWIMEVGMAAIIPTTM